MIRQFRLHHFFLVFNQYYFRECSTSGILIWAQNIQSFVPISNYSTFGAHSQKMLAGSLEIENHDFQGEILKLGYIQEHNVVNFYENNTKVTGACGEMWNILAEYSNFTLVTKRVKDFFARGAQWNASVVGLMYRKKIQILPRISFTKDAIFLADYTTPIWETRQRLYIQPEWKLDSNWMFIMFSYKVWCAILPFFIFLSLVGYSLQFTWIKLSRSDKTPHNLHDHLFYTFAILCDQSFTPETLDRRTKIVGLSKTIFAWLFLIVCSCHVISAMSNRKLRPPFDDVSSLLNKTNYTVFMYKGSIAFPEYRWMGDGYFHQYGKKKNITRRWKFSNSHELLYKTGCDQPKIAIFEAEDANQEFKPQHCELIPIGASYFPTWVTFGVTKGFKYKRTFDIGILKMREFGLIDRLRNRWLRSNTDKSGILGHPPLAYVGFEQVSTLFMVLSVGAVTSVIILFLEFLCLYKHDRRHDFDEDVSEAKTDGVE